MILCSLLAADLAAEETPALEGPQPRGDAGAPLQPRGGVLPALFPIAPWPLLPLAAAAQRTPAAAPGEEIEPAPEVEFSEGEAPRAELSSIVAPLDPQAGDRIAAYFVGSVEWSCRVSGQPIELKADVLVFYADFDEQPPAGDAAGEAAGEDAAAAPGREEPEAAAAALEESMTIAGWRFRRYTVYAAGRVRIDLAGPGSSLEADRFLYEHPSGMALAHGARLMTTVTRAQSVASVLAGKTARPDSSIGADPSDALISSPVVIRADVLRMYRFTYFDGAGVRVSNSTFAVPPLALTSETVEAYPADTTLEELERLKTMSLSDLERQSAGRTGGALPVPPLPRRRSRGAEGGAETGDGGDPAEEDAYVIDPEGTWLAVLGQPLVPLPMSHWDTRWSHVLPVHSAEYGSSSAYGPFVDLNWNLNYLFGLLPFGAADVARRIDRTSRLGFETAYFERRGFGYGPNARYGTSPRRSQAWRLDHGEWTYHGEARYFGIDDQGDTDRTTGLPVPREDRYWGHVWHRQLIPTIGTLDIEYSDLSDSAFLGEFFEEIAKEEKEQESLFYLRRTFGDNLALNGLYKYRTNDFQTVTERLPEGKLFLFQQPLFATGLYTDVEASGSQLRLRPGEPTAARSRRFERYDLLNQWSYPVHGLDPYVSLRPFAFGRYTYYGELEDPAASDEDRLTFAAGVTASQQWSRVFEFEPDSIVHRVFDIPQLKHMIVPQVTYLNVFSNDLDSEDLIETDDIDAVDLEESFTLSLRNDFFTRRRLAGTPGTHRPLVPGRELTLEDAAFETRRVFESNVSVVLYPQPTRDNRGDRSSVLRLDNTAWINKVRLRAWFELEPNRDFRLERMDVSGRFEVIRDQLLFGVGERLTRDRSSVLYADVRAWATPRWAFDGYWSHDLDSGRGVEWRVGVTRVFDRFAASLEFIEDVGEDRNKTFLFTVSPVEIFRADNFRL